jgi:hypothetical protein
VSDDKEVNMKGIQLDLKTNFFGHLVDFNGCIQDLILALKRTEETEFPYNPDPINGEGLINDIFPSILRRSSLVTLLITL